MFSAVARFFFIKILHKQKSYLSVNSLLL